MLLSTGFSGSSGSTNVFFLLFFFFFGGGESFACGSGSWFF